MPGICLVFQAFRSPSDDAVEDLNLLPVVDARADPRLCQLVFHTQLGFEPIEVFLCAHCSKIISMDT